MPKLHLHHATIVTMDEANTLWNDGAIVIDDSCLAYVGPAHAAPQVMPGDECLDAHGMVALPGLINAHTHLGMTLFRGAADDLPLTQWLEEIIWPVERRFTRDDIYWASLLGIAEQLRAGITTFCDMYWHIEAVTDAVHESGIRARLSGMVFGGRPDSQRIFDRAVQRVCTLLTAQHPRISTCFGPHAPYTVPIPMMRAVIAKAAELRVGISTHLSETTEEVERCRQEFGTAPIALMEQIGLFTVPVTAAHCVHPTEEEIGILAARNVGIVHCPGSNMKLGSGIAPVPALLQAGATVGLGTDSAGSNNTLDLLHEVRLAALLHKVHGHPAAVTAQQAIAMATCNSAKALHMPEIGMLQAGKLADVILLDFSRLHLTPEGRTISNLAYAVVASDVDTVIVHGRILMRHRQLLTLDEERIRAKVNESAHRLFQD